RAILVPGAVDVSATAADSDLVRKRRSERRFIAMPGPLAANADVRIVGAADVAGHHGKQPPCREGSRNLVLSFLSADGCCDFRGDRDGGSYWSSVPSSASIAYAVVSAGLPSYQRSASLTQLPSSF